MTVSAAYQWAVQRLSRDAGSPREARTTARILLDEICGFSHVHLRHGDRVLTGEQLTQFESTLPQLEQGRPLAYVLGKCEFFGRTFRCDERALIPRPETELLVEAAVNKICNPKSKIQNPTIVDLGTGTGCIAISLAQELPLAKIIATDASPEALTLARENASTHGVAGRIKFVPGVFGEWAAPLQKYSGRIDVIVSNPPYIAPRDVKKLQIQIKDFEPLEALNGGEDGLDCYRQIASQCGSLLKEHGVLLCELGANQFSEVRAIFENNGWEVGEAIFDLQGIARVLTAHRSPTS